MTKHKTKSLVPTPTKGKGGGKGKSSAGGSGKPAAKGEVLSDLRDCPLALTEFQQVENSALPR